MAEKKTTSKKDVELVKEEDKILVFKAKRPLDKGEFKLLSDLIKYEEKETGVKIVLMPYSCELDEIR